MFWARGGTWVKCSALPGLGMRLGIGLIMPRVRVLFSLLLMLRYWFDFSFGFMFSCIIREIAEDKACFGLGLG
jgi:hypothetical protein